MLKTIHLLPPPTAIEIAHFPYKYVIRNQTHVEVIITLGVTDHFSSVKKRSGRSNFLSYFPSILLGTQKELSNSQTFVFFSG